MAMTIRLSEGQDQLLTAIATVEITSKQALIDEAVNNLIKQRVESPAFRDRFRKYVNDLWEPFKDHFPNGFRLP